MTDATTPEPAFLQWAAALTKDAAEADALVAHALKVDSEQSHIGQTDQENRALLFRAMRQSYHSIERAKPPVRKRGPALTAPASAAEPDPSLSDEDGSE
jgi:hypothetical protein